MFGDIENSPGIYKLQCTTNGKLYIGKSLDVRKRILKHFKFLDDKKHHSIYLQRTYDKYGRDSILPSILEYIDIEKLENVTLEKYLGEREFYYYSLFEKDQLLNVDEVLPEGRIVSAESIKKTTASKIRLNQTVKCFAVNLQTQQIEQVFDTIAEAGKFVVSIGLSTNNEGSSIGCCVKKNDKNVCFGFGWVGEDRVYQDESGKYFLKEHYLWKGLRPIAQFDLEGNFIAIYESANVAAKENNTSKANIYEATDKDNYKAINCYWRSISKLDYVEYIAYNKQIENIITRKILKIFQYNLHTGKVIKVFDNPSDAVREAKGMDVVARSKKNQKCGDFGYCRDSNIIIDAAGNYLAKDVRVSVKQIGKFSQDNELIKVYYSSKLASESENLLRYQIHNATLKPTLLNDFYWKYIDFNTYRDFLEKK